MGGITLLAAILVGLGVAPAFAAATWAPTEAPLPANAAAAQSVALTQISCPATNWCVAIGNYNDSTGNSGGLIETLSGGTWIPSEAPVPDNAVGGADLSGVTCPAAGSCVAVGSYLDASESYDGVIETLSDGTWTPTQAPVPADVPVGTQHEVTFGPLACSAAGSCDAFGFYKVTGGQVLLFIDTLSNGTWTTMDAPVPSNAEGSVNPMAMTCPAVGSCVAVGSYSYGSGTQAGVIETLSNGTWTATEAPQLPSTATNVGTDLTAVACPAVGSCEATGLYEAAPDDGQSVIETLSDGAWTETQAPLPANATTETTGDQIFLYGLACPAVGSCVSVGQYPLSGSSATAPLIETLTDGIWTPVASSAGPSLLTLSCPALGSCEALGVNGHTPVVDTLSAGSWTVSALPLPSNTASQDFTMNGLNCPVAGSCLAVGDYTVIGGNQEGLIETLAGTATSTISSKTATAPAHSTITLGQSDTATATVTGSATFGSPTGTISFFVCGPTSGATPCSYLSEPVGAPVNLSPGTGSSSSAASVSFTPPGGGYWCFAAYYSGDSHYNASYDATTDGCLQIPRTSTSTALATTPPAVMLGQSVSAIATITGSATHGSPTGMVDFYWCNAGTAPSGCAANGAPAGLDVNTLPGAGAASTATSEAFTPGLVGYWCFAADYLGDPNYNPSSDDTADGCVDVTSLTQTSVTNAPALATISLGQSDTDTTTVTGNSTYGVPTGTISYFACGPTTAPAYCDTARDNPDGSVALTATGATSSTATSAPFTPNSTGYWCFSSGYSGNGSYSYNFDTTVDQCFDVVPIPLTFTSAASAAAAVKSAFTFSVTVTGASSPTITASNLPKWLTLINNGNGTATLTAKSAKKGRHKFTLTAANGSVTATQVFTLTVKK